VPIVKVIPVNNTESKIKIVATTNGSNIVKVVPAPGRTGLQGVVGAQGVQGVQGLLGIQGTQGVQGLQGTQGTTGLQGAVGIQGIQGLQGTQGIQGNTGAQGIQGIQGLIGDDGFIAQASPPENTSLLWLDTDEPEAVRPYSTRLFLSDSTSVEFDRGPRTGTSVATYEIVTIQSTGTSLHFLQILHSPSNPSPGRYSMLEFSSMGPISVPNISINLSNNDVWVAKLSISNASTSNAVVIVTRNTYANEIL
jgi:hypothetical protein